MSGGYYDIDAILATQQKLPCTFKLGVPGLGFLESADSRDVSIMSCCVMTDTDITDQRGFKDRPVLLVGGTARDSVLSISEGLLYSEADD